MASSSNVRVAVLGAGITGLAAARSLRQTLPTAKITVYEAQPTAGGCISTHSVALSSSQTVRFESGPRTIRPTAGDAAAALFHDAGYFWPNARFVRRSDPAARRRFIYYPDRVVEMVPRQSVVSTAYAIATEPLFSDLVPAFLREAWVAPRQMQRSKVFADGHDESVGSFLTRRLGPTVTRNIVSAVFHGIYAGDIYKLSAQAVVPSFVAREALSGSLLRSLARIPIGADLTGSEGRALRALSAVGMLNPELSARLRAEQTSTWAFSHGFGPAVDHLVNHYQSQHGIEFKFGASVSALRRSENGEAVDFDVGQENATEKESADYVVATIPAHRLSGIVQTSGRSPLATSLGEIRPVRVAVVNLYYSRPVVAIAGFGYLIPQSVRFEENPDFALGVIFDSFAAPDLNDDPAGTSCSLTVIFGGHWWDGWEQLPTETELVERAEVLVKRQLDITARPAATHARIWQDGIPQYTVGHRSRLRAGHYALQAHFGGRLKVAGQSYFGIGVNAAVESGVAVASALGPIRWEDRTGLDEIESASVRLEPR